MNIRMPRGDIKTISFSIYSGNAISTEALDDIYFTVKRNENDRHPVIQKRLSREEIGHQGNSYFITIMPEDTDCLEFGSYLFDIEIVKMPKIKQTFLGILTLTKEVTDARNEV
nr:MAG TPA: hypothetical protein [Caudoviricetes sp.]